MREDSKLKLPRCLEVYRTQIESTVKPVVKIAASKKETTIYQSKFAGKPYLPKDMIYPIDAHGRNLKLLAQLNFDEIPKVEDMPNRGILQFFISTENPVLGADFDNMENQVNFKILYHAKIDMDASSRVNDFSSVADVDNDFFPIKQELALTFTLDFEPVSIEDHKLDELLGDSVDLSIQSVDGGQETELWEVYSDTFLSDGHKLGGYPFFTQSDPRGDDHRYEDHNVLLLQIDSDFDQGIMWEDNGIANFFIKREDLKKLNFSNVIYNWDCY